MFSETLRELRKGRAMTQAELAKVFGLSTATIAMWETGKREPSSDTLVKLAEYFGVSVDRLIGSEKTLSLDEQLEGVDFALWGEVKQLTDAQKMDILDYIRYKKQRGDGK